MTYEEALCAAYDAYLDANTVEITLLVGYNAYNAELARIKKEYSR